MHLKGQRKQEFRDFIVELVLLYKPHTYCEIGVGKGYVYNLVVAHVKRAVAVDIRPFRGIKKGEGRLHFPMSSKEFALEWAKQENTQIDCLFIDADHRYESVMADFYDLQVYVPEHTGLILLHDTYPIDKTFLSEEFCGDAWKAAKDIRDNLHDSFEIVTLPGPRAGLSIIRKAKSHGWMDNEQS